MRYEDWVWWAVALLFVLALCATHWMLRGGRL